MDFEPLIPEPPRLMDQRIFRAESMGLREQLLALPLAARFSYDDEQNPFFVNFEGFAVDRLEDIDAVRRELEKHLAPLDHKGYAIVNYDNFRIVPDLLERYIEMVGGRVERYYADVTRYTTSSFLRLKLARRWNSVRSRRISTNTAMQRLGLRESGNNLAFDRAYNRNIDRGCNRPPSSTGRKLKHGQSESL